MRIPPQYRIVLIYVVLGALWIFFSDLVVAMMFDNVDDLNLAQSIKGWVYIGLTGALLFVLIRRDVVKMEVANQQLVRSYDEIVHSWVHVMDMRHKETRNHTERVTSMTVALAKLAGISAPDELKSIERGAMLHDIGKIGIPDEILIKPGKLTDDEWQVMQTHPVIAHEITANIEFIQSSVDIPYCHHERWDGTGYPRGLKGAEIPLSARMFAIIDVWDALYHPRVYKAEWPEAKVLEYIEAEAGKHFDPTLAKLFLDNYKDIKCDAGICICD